MKTLKTIQCVIAVLCLSLATAGQKPAVNPPIDASQPQRYQLFAARIEVMQGEPEQNTLFLLDTKNGKVWRYQSSFKYTNEQKKEVLEPEVFIPVNVGEYGLSERTKPPH